MKTSEPSPIVHRDSSFSAFITGAVIGSSLALLFGTKEGRKLTKKIKTTIAELSKDIDLSDLPQKIQETTQQVKKEAQAFTQNITPKQEPLGRLNRPPANNPPPTFTQNGKPL